MLGRLGPFIVLHSWAFVAIATLAATNSSPAAAAAADEQLLEELIVTAQRRSEDLQNTGVAATVLNADDLVDKSVFNLTSLQYAVPSVTISDYGSANVFNIRGIGRSQVDVDLPSGVVIYRDGAPTLAGYFQNEPYFDMASIEVLRGPQGTFVGKSAAGGAVFINTANPVLGEREIFMEVGGGDFDLFEFTGVVNVPVSDTVALRFAYNHYQRNDYYDSITGNFQGDPGTRDLNAGRIGLLWAPTDSLDVLLKVDVSDLDFGGNVTSSFGDDLFKNVDQNGPMEYTDESVRVVLDLKYEFAGGITLSSLTGYQDVETTNNLDLNGTQDLYYVFGSHADTEIISQEINLISPDDQRFRWVVGAFVQEQEFDIPYWQDGGFIFQGFVFGMDFPWATSPWEQDQDDWAIFAHAAVDITDNVELEFGIRYSDYEMDQFSEWVFGDGTAPPTIPWPFSVPPASVGGDSQGISEDSVDGKIGVNWTVNESHFVYGLISRGHVTGGVNLFPPFFDYDEMEVFNYEAGWKATFADGALRTQMNVFYQTFDNYQALFGMTGTGPASVSTFRNADGESDILGFELSAQAVLGNWGIDLGVAALDAELGTFRNVVDPFTLMTVDLTGAEPPFAPDFTLNIGIEYTIQFAGGMTLRPRIDYSHLSETQGGLWDSPMITLEDRDLINFQARLTPASDQWYASFWVTNATDEEYAGGIQNNGSLFYAAPPRMMGLRFGINL